MMIQQIHDWASKRPNDIAVITVQSPLGHVTFGELSLYVDSAAHALAARNVSPGSIINTSIEDSLLALIVVLGAAKIGVRRIGLSSSEMGWDHHLTDDANATNRITVDMLCKPQGRSWPEMPFPEILSATDSVRDPEAAIRHIREQLSPLGAQRCTCLVASAKGLVVVLERISLGACVMLSSGRLIDDLQFMELFCSYSLQLDGTDVERYFGPIPEIRSIPGLVEQIVFAGPPFPETSVGMLQEKVSNNIIFVEV